MDPNTDLTLRESGAIIQNLIEQYNSQRKLTYDTLKEKNLVHQWLMFQVSGRGPYFGQSAWYVQTHSDCYSEFDHLSPPQLFVFCPELTNTFELWGLNSDHRFTNLHPEKIQSAIDRYSTELKRVLGVLKGHFSGTATSRDSISGPR